MTVYLDTSHLVTLYLDEPDAEVVRQLVADADVLVTSIIAYAEARATFARRRKERFMTPAETRTAVRRLDADWPTFVVILLSRELTRYAGELADEHGIHGCDAVHLASFAELVSRSEDDVRFSCADERLVHAALALG